MFWVRVSFIDVGDGWEREREREKGVEIWEFVVWGLIYLMKFRRGCCLG